ncbi:hypothetical protein TUM20983_35100 [Mycobacterium antarcticum]|nr:hypothetical protein TUM20983_35100 [Mycolicibacterium sp. TUM20983]
MKRSGWAVVAAVLAIVVAVQVTAASDRASRFVADADVPTVAPGVDILAGIALIPARVHEHDYRRAAFGEAWTDDTSAPGGHNGCDTRFLGDFTVLRT